ncbi:alpha/beta hydrolase fold domain-containing protein [Arenimonas sp.]|uniref:alpha/beta hydrolase fold domain-containing protein n=1 Tax=Arenimonas sp. TaxID=1872635 RepID=UPI002E35190E|nr:alpha/beta hydrolase fold domain-containing protein [Arenimonas sp.]HEX4854042.1 alpha/beta hydrolase fold domain-containing protein [Arenimonas sp.]
MPLPDTLLAAALRTTQRLLLKPAFHPRWPVPWQRRWLHLLARIGHLPKGITRRDVVVGGVRAERWADERATPVRAGVVLYLHGGGYTVGSPRTHRTIAAWLARDSGLPVVVIDYRLAPEHPFPAALEDAVAAFDALATEGPVVVAGDSAGGGLALALAIRLRDRAREHGGAGAGPQPAALVLLAPLVDLRESSPLPAVPGEAMLSERWARANARAYAAGRADDPLVSPLLADLRGLPPVLVQNGSDDLLAAQSVAIVAKLRGDGVEVVHDFVPGRWHVFQLQVGTLPSAGEAVSRIARFLAGKLPPLPNPSPRGGEGLQGSSPLSPRGRGAGGEATHHTLILGAGMSGLCAAIQLQNAGLHDFVILEQSEGLGGTWWDNRYPGAQVDVPAPAYAFSFAPNTRWTQRFANAPEIHAYQQALAEKHALSARLRLGTRLLEARFDEADGLWHFRTSAGDTLRARFFICSTGPLSQPRWPDLPGLDAFEGLRLHSARWPVGQSFEGMRVGVIGTGSTAVQLVPPIAAQAARLHVFQRTANWVLPRLERRYFGFDRALSALPPYAAAVRAFWVAFLELGRRGFEDGTLMRRFMLWWAGWHRRKQLADDGLRAALTPDYPLGCKRIIYSSDYYPALSKPHVELVTTGIERITARGIRTADGVERELDALVCATGFDTVHLLQSLDIRGRGGVTLAEAWRDGPEAFHGIHVAGFPNMFLMLGPNTATGHTSTLLYIEPAVRHAIACMQAVAADGHRAIEVHADTQRAHNAALQARLGRSVWAQCRSWYRMDGGKVVAIFPGFTREYVEGLRRQRPEELQLTPSSPPNPVERNA